MSYPEPSREITVIPWRQEEMVLAASPYHPLARAAASCRAARSERRRLHRLRRRPAHPPRSRPFPARARNVQVNMTLHFDNLQMIKEAVAHGSGVSIMPARVMEEEVAQGRLVPLPIAGPELYRPVGIVHRRRKRFHRAAQAFLELLQESPDIRPARRIRTRYTTAPTASVSTATGRHHGAQRDSEDGHPDAHGNNSTGNRGRRSSLPSASASPGGAGT